MAEETAPTAPPKGGLVPYIEVEGALKASQFYQKAFGAEEASAVPPDEQGRSMHVHLYVNGSSLMLNTPIRIMAIRISPRRAMCFSSSLPPTRSMIGGSGRWMPAAR